MEGPKRCPDCAAPLEYLGYFVGKPYTGRDYRCNPCHRTWRRFQEQNTLIYQLRKNPIFNEPDA